MSVILATAGYDREICFWDAPSGICTKKLPHSGSQVNQLEISPDKQFLAAAGHSEIRLYEIEGASTEPVLTLKGHSSSVTSLGFHRQHRYLYSGSEDGTLKLWDLRCDRSFQSFNVQAPVNSVALRVDREEIVSGDANGMVKLWDLTMGGNDEHDTTGTNGTSSVTTNRQGRTLSSTHQHTNNQNNNKLHQSPGLIHQVQPAEGRVGGCLMQTPIQAVDISLHSRTLVAVSNHGTAYVWNPWKNTDTDNPFGEPVTKFRAHPQVGSYCLHARISPDCKSLCTTGSDGTAKLWDTTTWELKQNLQPEVPAAQQPHQQQPQSNESRSGSSSGQSPESNSDEESSSQPTPWIWDAAFCDDSNYLVTASSDTTARIWKLEEGKVVKEYRGHQQGITCVALNDSTLE